MSNSRDPSVDGRSRPGARTGTKPLRDPTESMAQGEEEDRDFDGDDMDPLSSSQAPLGTRDRRPRNDATRIESPAARNRTPQPPAPAEIVGAGDPRRGADSGRKSRPSKPPPPKSSSEKPEERIGSVLGSYRLVELLGRGGMGFVYKAEHVKLGRTVALKLLRADYARRRDSVARFFQEARTVNRVRHRNIVDVTDFVELQDGDGTTFIIMEMLEGKSLGRWVKAGYTIPRALALLVQICDGLAAAHAVGVIHRDLKPDNVIVVPTGDGAELVKLLDFGVAKLLNRDDEDVGLETQAGSVIGTPAYMSPEQAGGTTVDVRSDIYSLGAIMYEVFTGQPMFRGRSFGEFVRKHLNEQPVAPRATAGGAGLDERLEQVILRCIEKQPERRYQSLAELRDDLLHLLGAIDTQVGMVRDLGNTDSLSSKDLLPSSSRRASRVSDVMPAPAPLPTASVSPGRRWPWIAAAVVIGGAAIATIAIALSGDDPGTPRQAPAESRAAVPAPEVVPLGEPTPRRGAMPTVDVRFESTPEAEVFPVGSARRQCATPCTVSIDPGDGGATTHRDFVVRAPGHVEKVVTIDLGAPPPAVIVELDRKERDRDRPPEKKVERKVSAPEPEPEPEPEPVKQPEPKRTDPEPKGKDTKDGKKIDPSDTLDPFGSSR